MFTNHVDDEDAWRDELEVKPERKSLDDILAGLTPSQSAAARHKGPALVLAGAGSGKTKTLTAGIACRIERGIPAHRILAVTFTNKAAGEMKDRVAQLLEGRDLPTWMGTFSGLGARQLRVEPEVAFLRPRFDIADADDTRRLLRRTMKEMGIHPEDCGKGSDPLKLVANRISGFKDNLVTPEECESQVETMIADANGSGTHIDAAGLRITAKVYVEYQRRLREANAADFGDLLLWPTTTMIHDEAYRLRWARRFDAVLADEYQDINHVQYAWLWCLAKDHLEIFGVGDDDQAIFGWRGSDIAYIRRFTNEFPDAAVHKLEHNFRSTGHIVNCARAVISKDKKRLNKTLHATRPDGEKVEVVWFRDADCEARGIVQEIVRRKTTGLRWQDMAILYRSNRMSRSFEEHLMRAQVPYVLVGDVGFYQRQEVKDTLALLRLATNPDHYQGDEAFRRVCNTPKRELGDKAIEDISNEAAFRGCSLLTAVETAPLRPKARSAALAFADAIRAVHADKGLTLADRISLLVDSTGYRAMWRDSQAEEAADRLENIQEIINLAQNFHDGNELLDHAALGNAAPGQDTEGRVQLMTMHKSKGLEFGHVFLPGWDKDCFPSTNGDFEEERRLAYVSLTRGMESVSVTHAEYRQGRSTVASPFIDDLPVDDMVLNWRHKQRDQDPAPVTVVRKSSFPRLGASELLRRF